MLKTRTLLVLSLAMLCLAAGSLAKAQETTKPAVRRVALVIGNTAYAYASQLENPRNDATDVSEALRSLGFEVITGIDLDKAAMDRTIRRFAGAMQNASVGAFFYAGHGIQVDGRNYLVPVDARLEDASGIDFELVSLGLVQRTMERSAGTNIIFLDACRDNPLARNLARAMGTRSAAIGRGLAAMESGVGTLISFSTQPGNVALDGEGRNSPFAAALVKRLLTVRDDVSDLLIGVRRDVMAATSNRQVPWEHSALTDRFYFAPRADREPPIATVLSYEQQAELAFWSTIRDSRDKAIIQSYLDTYPKGIFAGLARARIASLKRPKSYPNPTAPALTSESKRTEPSAAERPATPPTDPFDGKWRLVRIAPECKQRPRVEMDILIQNSRIAMPKIVGQITSGGQIQFKIDPGDGSLGEFDGRLAGDAGTLDFRGLRADGALSCAGSATMTRAAPVTVTPAVGIATSAAVPADPKVLATELQRELARVGCYSGVIDGDWGPASRAAQEQFNRHARLALPVHAPDARAIGAIQKILTPICPAAAASRSTAPQPTSAKAASSSGENCKTETREECLRRNSCRRGSNNCALGTCAPQNRLKTCN